jgi:hypothetical protein
MKKEVLFQYVVVEYPTVKEAECGTRAVIVSEGNFLSKDETTARMEIVAGLPNKRDFSQIEIHIRPF